jgi:hypothetical protein
MGACFYVRGQTVRTGLDTRSGVSGRSARPGQSATHACQFRPVSGRCYVLWNYEPVARRCNLAPIAWLAMTAAITRAHRNHKMAELISSGITMIIAARIIV